uniref:Uncharacterized protein n=1 Tax=Parascaris univalens TaxID=6257 RepID=A0A915CK75_PARUN
LFCSVIGTCRYVKLPITMTKVPKVYVALLILALVTATECGLFTFKLCVTACNAAVVACYAAFGLVFGTVTAGAGAPAGALACNAAQSACMMACGAVGAATVP